MLKGFEYGDQGQVENTGGIDNSTVDAAGAVRTAPPHLDTSGHGKAQRVSSSLLLTVLAPRSGPCQLFMTPVSLADRQALVYQGFLNSTYVSFGEGLALYKGADLPCTLTSTVRSPLVGLATMPAVYDATTDANLVSARSALASASAQGVGFTLRKARLEKVRQ